MYQIVNIAKLKSQKYIPIYSITVFQRKKKNQWRIQEFQNWGGGGLFPGTLEILGSGDSFDTPSMICPVFSSESRE